MQEHPPKPYRREAEMIEEEPIQTALREKYQSRTIPSSNAEDSVVEEQTTTPAIHFPIVPEQLRFRLATTKDDSNVMDEDSIDQLPWESFAYQPISYFDDLDAEAREYERTHDSL